MHFSKERVTDINRQCTMRHLLFCCLLQIQVALVSDSAHFMCLGGSDSELADCGMACLEQEHNSDCLAIEYGAAHLQRSGCVSRRLSLEIHMNQS